MLHGVCRFDLSEDDYADCRPTLRGPAHDMYVRARSVFWRPEKVADFSTDRENFALLPPAQQTMMAVNLGFLLYADGFVIDNLVEQMIPALHPSLFDSDLDFDGVKRFLNFQVMMEDTHAETYTNGWNGTIPYEMRMEYEANRAEKLRSIPGVAAKFAYMRRYGGPNVPFAERLVAWILAEGLFFQENFGNILWFPSEKFPSVHFSNELISADENLHTLFTILLWRHLCVKLSDERVHEMFREAVQHARTYCYDMIPEPQAGLSAAKLYEYAQYRCDKLLGLMEMPSLFGVKKNPLPWMRKTAIDEVTNFLERPVSAYQIGAIKTGSLVSSSGGRTSDEDSGSDGAGLPEGAQTNILVQLDPDEM